jgi:hypothetical protein
MLKSPKPPAGGKYDTIVLILPLCGLYRIETHLFHLRSVTKAGVVILRSFIPGTAGN